MAGSGRRRTHFNGLISTSKGLCFADLGTDPILAAAKVPGAGIWQMIFAIGALEVYWEGKYPSYECAGNFGVRPSRATGEAQGAADDRAEARPLYAPRRTPRLFAAARVIFLRSPCFFRLLRAVAMIGIISFASAAAIPGSVPFYPF